MMQQDISENPRKALFKDTAMPKAKRLFGTLCLLSMLLPTVLTTALQAQEQAPVDSGKDESRQKPKKDYYPTVKHPPGFYEGAILFGLLGGQTLAPSGSYIRDEKVYDSFIEASIRLGNFTPVPELPELQPGVYFEPEYDADAIYQMDIEYGVWEHIGMGLTLFQFYMNARRQDAYNFPNGIRLYDPFPKKTNLYQGSGAAMLVSFHPIARKFLDPYLALRAGMVGFTGEAHRGPYNDTSRYSNKIQNGLGTVIGAGLGVNIFVGRTFGIRIEGDYYRQFLKSNLFSTRTLNTYHAQIGIFMNVASFAGGKS